MMTDFSIISRSPGANKRLTF